MIVWKYSERGTNYWFWRTKEQKKLDCRDEGNGVTTALELKWNSEAKVKSPKQFSESYPNTILKIVNKDNFNEFLL
jgi:uncharacterized protein